MTDIIKTVRRGALLLLILSLITACAGESDSVAYRPEEGSAAGPVEVTVREPEEEKVPVTVQEDETAVFADPEDKEPLPAGGNAKVDTEGIELKVTDGKPYGTGIVCWVEGFGLCYELGTDPDQAVLSVEKEPLEDIEPFETHRLLLAADGTTYCLAELRFNSQDPKRTVYKIPYDIVIMDSDLVDLAPSGADWEKIAPMEKDGETVFDSVHAGILCGYDEKAGTVDVFTMETAGFSDEYGIVLLPDTFSDEPITLKVTDDSVLAAQGTEYELLLTRERFFALIREGYVGFIGNEENEDMFTGCFIGYNGDTLTYLCEISGETE